MVLSTSFLGRISSFIYFVKAFFVYFCVLAKILSVLLIKNRLFYMQYNKYKDFFYYSTYCVIDAFMKLEPILTVFVAMLIA